MSSEHPQVQAMNTLEGIIKKLEGVSADLLVDEPHNAIDAKLDDIINQLYQLRFSLPGMTYSVAASILGANLQELQGMSGNQMPDIDRIIPLVNESTQAMTFMQSRLDSVNAYLSDKGR